MTKKGRFSQADITKAVKAVFACGLEVEAVEIDGDGKITVRIANQAGPLSTGADANEWTDDDV